MRTALISVFDKTGVVEFARGLAELGFELLSTGGTAKALRDAGLQVTEVSDYTGAPELFKGRVKTLHPKIAGGILFKRGRDDDEAVKNGVKNIELVCVNLYPFGKAVHEEYSEKDAVEEIDIGGVALLRAAAKNFESVAVVSSPNDYDGVLVKLKEGALDFDARKGLAVKAFAKTAAYDALIAKFFGFDGLALVQPKSMQLRYGENPHQQAALYGFDSSFKQLSGKELSFNNLVDVDAAIAMAHEFKGETVAVVVKHSNPCGGAVGESQKQALEKALQTDSLSAFGGVFAFNAPLEKDAAEILAKRFVEVIAAPGFENGVVDLFAGKKTVLLDVTKAFDLSARENFKSVFCGTLVQDADSQLVKELKTVSKREPSGDEKKALLFAWKFCKHVKSNAIVLARDGQLVGVGAGQMSRVDSVKLAIEKAERSGLETNGSVLASDAFFPFRDGVDEAHEAGVTAIIQPGGSVKDSDVIQATDEHGMAMVFAGLRHFKH
ncbi:MAG: bifunctional phosphoribosylaminoimidazolecarboxamide formyltransferase/IMP cyclohydrolase [Candidatus Micrarchaeota archaeon]